jgi:hypothetical protein
MLEPEAYRLNRARLLAQQPGLEAHLQGSPWSRLDWLPSRSSSPTLRCDGHLVHSLYDPMQEATRLASGKPESLHIHLGLGLGYLLQTDLSQHGRPALVYEPSPELLSAFLCRDDLQWFDPARINLCCDLETFEKALRQTIPQVGSLRILVLPYHRHHYPAELKQALEILEKNRQYQDMGRATLSKVSPIIHASTLRSLPLALSSPPLDRLVHSFRGLPAVIVAAGPSLEKNLQVLHAFADRVLIFAISRAVRILEYHGLQPHFVVHIEAQDYSSLLEGCTNLHQAAFLLPDQVERRILELHPEPNYFFDTPVNMVTQWLGKRFPQLRRITLETGGSVATEAFLCAKALGCEPIVLIGQDLATLDGKIYASSPTNADFSYLPVNCRTVPGYFGQPVASIENYQHFIYWYQDQARSLAASGENRLFINATEGGAQIRGFVQRPFLQVAEEYFGCSVEAEFRQIIQKTRHPPSVDLAQVAALLADFRRQLAEISSTCSHGLRQLEQTRKFLARMELAKLKTELRRLDLTMEDFTKLNQDWLVFSGFYQRALFEARDQAESAKREGDLLRQISAQLDELQPQFSGASQAADNLLPLLSEVEGELIHAGRS